VEISGRICKFVAVSCEGFGNPAQLTATWKSCATTQLKLELKKLKNLVLFLLLISLSSCANLFHRDVLLHTWEQHTIGKYKFVHGQYGHFPRRYNAYRLYKIRKNGREKMLSTTDFKFLDSAKCIVYFEIKDRRKIYFDICKLKRLKRKSVG
jgi:hypothetical protein